MRKKWMLLLLGIGFVFIMAGCNDKEVQPSDVFNQYVKLWNKQDFANMYSMQTDEAKELATKKEFVNRYEKIYSDLEVTDLKVSFKTKDVKEVEKDTKKVTIPFTVSMNTIAGTVTFEQEAELVKVESEDEEVNWLVNWNTGFIFSGMESEDKVGISTTSAMRGKIVDRNGVSLAVNGEVIEVGIVPEGMEGQEDSVKAQLAQYLNLTVEEIDNALSASWVQPNYFVPIKKISNDNSTLVEQLVQLPGVQIKKVSGRYYPLGEAAAHLIGYVGEVTAEDIEKNEGYSTGDVIGKRGAEQLFEEELKGQNGVTIYIEKPDGTKATIAEQPVQDGETIQLTIDSQLQQEIASKFNGKAGTAVALQPKTGETLALVSSPSFDPNAYMFMSSSERKVLEDDSLQPLLSRFVNPQTPGSSMKVFTASIGLETGTITPEQERTISGLKWQKDSSWGGYYITRVHDSDSSVNLQDAFVYSDNIYFAQTALDIGESNFISGLKKFGFEEEIPYTYPLKNSKISNDGTLSSDILLADSGYGQGEVQANIVQLAAGYTAFINNGNMIKPILLTSEALSQVWKENVIATDTAKTIAEDLRQVVENPNGTGHAAYMSDYALSGKTGTAEVGKQSQGEQATENGWFVAYNTDQQDLLIAMMIEGVQNEGGSKVAVTAVKEIFESRK